MGSVIEQGYMWPGRRGTETLGGRQDKRTWETERILDAVASILCKRRLAWSCLNIHLTQNNTAKHFNIQSREEYGSQNELRIRYLRRNKLNWTKGRAKRFIIWLKWCQMPSNPFSQICFAIVVKKKANKTLKGNTSIVRESWKRALTRFANSVPEQF